MPENPLKSYSDLIMEQGLRARAEADKRLAAYKEILPKWTAEIPEKDSALLLQLLRQGYHDFDPRIMELKTQFLDAVQQELLRRLEAFNG